MSNDAGIDNDSDDNSGGNNKKSICVCLLECRSIGSQ